MEKTEGFTAIELLVVIVIIGILVAIALPSYQAHINKANRITAQIALTKLAQEFERANARQGAYPTVISPSVDNDTYTFVRVSSADDTFTITATPIGRSADDECGALSINQAGQTSPSFPSDCWN